MVTSWYSEDNREVPMEVLNGETEDPFAEGEAVKFDCFPFGSTKNDVKTVEISSKHLNFNGFKLF